MKPIIVTYDEVLKMKSAVAERFSDRVHFHDGCGAQYFNLEQPNTELRDFLISYYKKQGAEARFSDDGLDFRLFKILTENKNETK